MRRSWDTTAGPDHALHLSRTERSPTFPDLPRYPDLHGLWKNTNSVEEDLPYENKRIHHHRQQQHRHHPPYDEELHYKDRPSRHHHHGYQQPYYQGYGHGDGHNRVRVSEHVESIGDDGSFGIDDTSIDVEADGFIQQKHRIFELSRSKTFSD